MDGEEFRLIFFGALKRNVPRSSEVFSLLEMMFGQVPPGDLPVAPPQEIVLKPGGPWQGRGGWEGQMAWYTLLKLRSREVGCKMNLALSLTYHHANISPTSVE